MSEAAQHFDPPEDDETRRRREWLGELRLAVEDGSIWETPPVREQLKEHLERLGL